MTSSTDNWVRRASKYIAAVLALMAFAHAACQSTATRDVDEASDWSTFRYRSCDESSACPGDFRCVDDRCLSENRQYVMTATACESNDDCALGMGCMEGFCVVNIVQCVSDFDCSTDEVCYEGHCVDESRCDETALRECGFE